MKPITSDYTHVVAGYWNTAILNPQWIGENLFEGSELQLEMMVGSGLPTLRILHDKVIINPSANRLVVSAREPTAAGVEQAEAVVARILELLPVTPISAIGVNFAFEEDEPGTELAKYFESGDLLALAKAGHETGELTISRVIRLKERALTARLSLTEGKVKAHFNFHLEIAGKLEAPADAVRGRSLGYFDQAIEISEKIYGLHF